MEREVMWAPWKGPGLEHLRLVASNDGAVANGLVIGLEAGRPVPHRLRDTLRRALADAGSTGALPRSRSGQSSSCSPTGRTLLAPVAEGR